VELDGLRVLARRASSPPRVILEIELDLNGVQPAQRVTESRRARLPASPSENDERRMAAAMGLALLSGFVVVAAVAALIAIFL
jgi:hypothetical protein